MSSDIDLKNLIKSLECPHCHHKSSGCHHSCFLKSEQYQRSVHIATIATLKNRYTRMRARVYRHIALSIRACARIAICFFMVAMVAMWTFIRNHSLKYCHHNSF